MKLKIHLLWTVMDLLRSNRQLSEKISTIVKFFNIKVINKLKKLKIDHAYFNYNNNKIHLHCGTHCHFFLFHKNDFFYFCVHLHERHLMTKN